MLYAACPVQKFTSLITSRAHTESVKIEIKKVNQSVMKLRAWGNAYCMFFWPYFNDLQGKAEIHFQGHLSCCSVSVWATLWPNHGPIRRKWAPGHRKVPHTAYLGVSFLVILLLFAGCFGSYACFYLFVVVPSTGFLQVNDFQVLL